MCFNFIWFDVLGVKGIIELCVKFLVVRMLERDDFIKCYKENCFISIVEFLYFLL